MRISSITECGSCSVFPIMSSPALQPTTARTRRNSSTRPRKATSSSTAPSPKTKRSAAHSKSIRRFTRFPFIRSATPTSSSPPTTFSAAPWRHGICTNADTPTSPFTSAKRTRPVSTAGAVSLPHFTTSTRTAASTMSKRDAERPCATSSPAISTPSIKCRPQFSFSPENTARFSTRRSSSTTRRAASAIFPL